jgi:hypothetical protein
MSATDNPADTAAAPRKPDGEPPLAQSTAGTPDYVLGYVAGWQAAWTSAWFAMRQIGSSSNG